ncbi:class III extradiol dioxygenase subunit beta [Sulfurospirillum sp. 1612]|uniref:class III extradiol dioxygenase subunit beta n=1 Tax=Sulfurospirillum sp. 1612 TaxID=3094835 RepID=UPI002F931DB9
MAKIIGGIGTSHIPTVGHVMDSGTMVGDYWEPFINGIQPARQWIKKNKPDVCIVVYNDHGSNFSLKDVIPFGIGMADKFLPADEGYGRRNVPTCYGHQALSAHIAESLIFDEFDIVMSNELDVDHGLTVPLSILYDQPSEWPCKVIPLYVGVVQYPQPTGNRCYNLGKAIRKAVDSFPEDITVAILGTGGLSHQLQGPRAGLINQDYDQKWLTGLVNDPLTTKDISHTELIRETGSEGIEAIMWLVMRGAMDDKVNEVYRFMHAPVSNTNYSLIILENQNKGGK